MKKSILFGLIAVFSVFLTTSIASAFCPSEPVLKVYKASKITTEVAGVVTLDIVAVNGPETVIFLGNSIDFDSKISLEDDTHKEFGLPAETIHVKRPNVLHLSYHTGYRQKLESFSRSVYSNRIQAREKIFSKVRFI